MANKTKTSNAAVPSYIDFNPACAWQKEETLETLIIHLPDFDKNQLRVQVNKEGVLRVSGEIPILGDGSKKSRFLKETKLPEGCDMNEVRAKFSEGSLIITMPKKATKQQQQQQPAASTLPAPPPPLSQPEDTTHPQNPKAAESADDQKAKGTSTEHGAMDKTSSYGQTKADQMFEDGSIRQRLKRSRKVVFGFEIAALTMIAIGAFVAFKYGSKTISSPSSLYMDD